MEGVQNILIDRHLMDDETKFREYFRLTPFLSRKILDGIENDVASVATSWVRNPISAYHKLCITLRYLATGETFRSLAFQYRIHHSTIGRIVENCLTAIIARFMTKAIPQPTATSHQQAIADFYSKWSYRRKACTYKMPIKSRICVLQLQRLPFNRVVGDCRYWCGQSPTVIVYATHYFNR